MSIKDEILKIFEQGRGQYFSGGELAENLGVSRTAVWKAVKQLEEEGYRFEAVSGRGYSLCEDNDVLSEYSIRSELGGISERLDIKTCQTITSTNTVLKEMAVKGAPEGIVLIAAEQTAGKGRMSRSFFSPNGTGLYLSILLRPKMSASESLFITTAAAVAVARAIEDISGRKAGIKWVNDVFLDGKKVCGILTEASLDVESGGLEYAIPGIGVNITPPQGGFPDKIKDIASAVFERDNVPGNVRNRLAALIIKYFMEYYDDLTRHSFFEEYVRRSVIIGRDVMVLGKGEPKLARAIDIDSECGLHVRYASGEEEILSSGEVSIKRL